MLYMNKRFFIIVTYCNIIRTLVTLVSHSRSPLSFPADFT